MNVVSILAELQFKFARSGGAGGQHVNKVSSKVILQWHVSNSNAVSQEEKARLTQQLSGRINKEGFLLLECDTDRSQARNKAIVTDRFLKLLHMALAPVKARKKTKATYASVLKRLDQKKRKSVLKAIRRRGFDQ